jgi:hypothetical protein
VFFDLGGGHNAIEVNEASYNANDPTPVEIGFEVGFGESGFFIPLESKNILLCLHTTSSGNESKNYRRIIPLSLKITQQ